MSALTDSTNTIKPEAENVGKPVLEDVEKVAVETSDNTTEAVSENTAETVSEESAEVVSEKSSETVSEKSAETVSEETAKTVSENTTETEKSAETDTETAATESSTAPIEVVMETDAATEEPTEEKDDVMETEEAVEAQETNEEKEKRFEETLITGRRFMKTSAFNKATEALSIGAGLAEDLFGTEHEKTFEVFLAYGQALLELAKIEDGVLNNALTDMPKEGEEQPEDGVVGNPDTLPDEERAEIKQKVEEALGVVEEVSIAEETSEEAASEEPKTEEEASKKSTETIAVEQADDVDMEAEQPVEDEAVKGETEADAAVAAENAEAEADAEAESDEDDSMKLAWEILETARLACESRIQKLSQEDEVDHVVMRTWRLNNADVLTTLGEHGLADSKYPQAQEDLKKALAIQQELLPVTSRVIANTFHLIGKALAADELFVEAEKQFITAKDILSAKVDELKEKLDSASDEEKNEINSEIRELEGIIPDIQMVIEDARLTEEQRQQLKAEATAMFDAVAADKEKLSNVETTDISNLVRRPAKRPADEEKVEEAKKRKSEDGSATIPETTEASGESETAPAPVTAEE